MNSTDSLFNLEKVNSFYEPQIAEYARLGTLAGLSPAINDKIKTLVIIIDNQNDFHFKWGTLCVTGALDDLSRFLQWLYRNIDQITAVMPTFDTHVRFQIFFSEAWINIRTREHPEPFTDIYSSDILSGKWKCVYGNDWALYYTMALEAKGRHLTIWPQHTMLGTDGQKLVPALAEAIAYFESARDTKSIPIIKGLYPKSEHYGVYGPEVTDEFVDMDFGLIEMVNTYDRIIYAGQASDFCLLTSVQQHVDYLIAANLLEDIKKITVLTDCTSSVIKFPDVEWAKLQGFGITLTESLSFNL